jgi:hypothetical protein
MLDQEDILYIQVERCICSFPLDQVSEYLRSDQLIGTILNIDDLPFCANPLLLSQLFPRIKSSRLLLLFEV